MTSNISPSKTTAPSLMNSSRFAVSPTRSIQSCLRFGDVAHAPPDLAKIPKPRGFKDQGQAKPWARQAAANAGGGVGAAGTSSGGSVGKQGQQQQQSRKRSRGEAKRKGVAGGRAGQTQFVSRDLCALFFVHENCAMHERWDHPHGRGKEILGTQVLGSCVSKVSEDLVLPDAACVGVAAFPLES